MNKSALKVADLDSPETWSAIDPGDMLGRIGELPEQCENAWAEIMAMDIPLPSTDFHNVLVLGMGGSAIGGDLVRTLVWKESQIPMIVNRDYDIPAFVNKHTLAIASSYSGNTEETLSSLEQVQESGAVLVAISTGGELARRAQASNIPTVPIKYDSQPRAALGHSLVLLLGVLQKANLIADKSGDLEEAVGVMRKLQAEICAEVPTAENPAKQLAIELQGRLPIVYGAGYLSEVARRWKGQFNENAKNWSFFEILPELNHNAVLGYQFPAELAQHLVVITLRSHLDHPRNRKRADVTQEMLEQRGIKCRMIESRGESPLAVMLSSIHFGDYVSYYLALLNGADPTTVDAISYLKKRLAEMN